MCEDDGECCHTGRLARAGLDAPLDRTKEKLTYSHDHQESCAEASKIHHASARALNKVIGVGAPAADPVGQRRDHVGRDDQQRVVDLP